MTPVQAVVAVLVVAGLLSHGDHCAGDSRLLLLHGGMRAAVVRLTEIVGMSKHQAPYRWDLAALLQHANDGPQTKVTIGGGIALYVCRLAPSASFLSGAAFNWRWRFSAEMPMLCSGRRTLRNDGSLRGDLPPVP